MAKKKASKNPFKRILDELAGEAAEFLDRMTAPASRTTKTHEAPNIRSFIDWRTGRIYLYTGIITTVGPRGSGARVQEADKFYHFCGAEPEPVGPDTPAHVCYIWTLHSQRIEPGATAAAGPALEIAAAYKTLGVRAGAEPAAIHAAYRKLIEQNHPDRNPGDLAREIRSKEVTAAYTTLKTAKLAK